MDTRKHTRSRERRVAIHEAGHAVAAFFQHQRILRATIVPKAGSLGHVRHAPRKFTSDEGLFDDSLRGIDCAEKTIIGLYAGGLAERKFAPRSSWRQGRVDDLYLASQVFSHIDSADDKYNCLYSKLLWRRAELLVDLHWLEINAVADALLQHRTLDSDGVRAAILGALGLKRFKDGENNANPKGEIDHG